jgi:hypothetical protein
MRSIIIFFICSLSFISYGQGDFKTQYNLIKTNINKPWEIIRDSHFVNYEKRFAKDTFFIDYILSKYSTTENLKKFISNRYTLKKFSDVTLRQNRILLSVSNKDIIEINIEKEFKDTSDIGLITYDSTYVGKINEPGYEFKYIKTVNNKQAYGFTFDTSGVIKVKFISIKINGNETLIDNTLFEDLYFPNFCEVDHAIKPVEAFLSPDRKYIYLYLFGGQENSEYFCKIIFDIKNRNAVGRMIADHKELEAYQCLYPTNFIGF